METLLLIVIYIAFIGLGIPDSLMGSQIAFAYIGVMLALPLVSIISGLFGIKVYPVLLAVCLKKRIS